MDGKLGKPPPGVGRFLLHLSGMGLRIIPVGGFEENGTFSLRFGEGYELHLPGDLPAPEKDRRAAAIVMKKIANQLPPHLRGEFSE